MSPIEKKLYCALIDAAPVDIFVFNGVADTEFGDEDSGRIAWLSHEEQVLSYRVDFSLITNGGLRLVIECDGHDFHERTKQQAAHDRARDRELLAIGIRTVRFTGSEIHHYAQKCAHEVWRIFALVLDEEDAPISTWHAAFNAGVRSVTEPKAPRGGL